MLPLDRTIRKSKLEPAIRAARDVAEAGAKAALDYLGVADRQLPVHLTEIERVLRRRLRAHGRQLGDSLNGGGVQDMGRLIGEVAYEHWHRMLFARFLAENNLLMYPDPVQPIAVSLAECQDLAADEGAKSGWELAARFAARMLPQIFRPGSPVFELSLPPEHQHQLETLLGGLPPETFMASDSLGWVYQFWQAKRKDEVNASEVKIGADELPAVTQLFTEPYMVDFLLHNSLGAWWVTRHPGKPCPARLTYLRTLDDGTPAAGTFEGWPDDLSGFKLLDPCCGSGHFLVAAFLMLVPMRMQAESLSAMDAVDAVVADNLHGLELDARCVEIAVFALALAAWRFPDENGDPLGVRADMPAPQIACCGLNVAAKPEDWMALVPDDASNAQLLRQELRLLHASFAQAPLLGSLLDPARSLKNDLATSSFDTLRDLLERALSTERPATLWGQASELDDETLDLALAARGLLDAARLLNERYHLVMTNVPYLSLGKQNDVLKAYCETYYPDGRHDLANVFLERCLELTKSQSKGVVQIVMPQSWLFLTRYKRQREYLLKNVSWNLLARLGPGAFETISGKIVQAVLLTQSNTPATKGFLLRGVDASAPRTPYEKADKLRATAAIVSVSQLEQLNNPDAVVQFEQNSSLRLLSDYVSALSGVSTGELSRFTRQFWEVPRNESWEFIQTSVNSTDCYGGLSNVIFWEKERGALYRHAQSVRHLNHAAQNWLRGKPNWGRPGVCISKMSELESSLYSGEIYDENCCALIPENPEHVLALWAFCSSDDYTAAVRNINQSLLVQTKYLIKIPFDIAYWQQVGAERYPNGLPKPYSDNPTQWLFHGHPQPCALTPGPSPGGRGGSDCLQVAVARLAGYRWPAETDTAMELADEARTWIARCDQLAEHTDDDGIVCLPSVRGEAPAHDRLLKLLIAAWETRASTGSARADPVWKPAVLDKLLLEADCAGKGLDVWLREKFFLQHCKRFHHRPFIWHIWDGLRDGFAALVNYHKLDRKQLETLTYRYLGDWIIRQKQDIGNGVDGAQERLAAAENLQKRLELILEGETPYDIFVRWKPLAQQPIGWEPDLNDGVRLNIRPFMTAQVLRFNKKPQINISWDKDRGKDVASAPWFHVFKGDRINDHHLSLAEKRAARAMTTEGG